MCHGMGVIVEGLGVIWGHASCNEVDTYSNEVVMCAVILYNSVLMKYELLSGGVSNFELQFMSPSLSFV